MRSHARREAALHAQLRARSGTSCSPRIGRPAQGAGIAAGLRGDQLQRRHRDGLVTGGQEVAPLSGLGEVPSGAAGAVTADHHASWQLSRPPRRSSGGSLLEGTASAAAPLRPVEAPPPRPSLLSGGGAREGTELPGSSPRCRSSKGSAAVVLERPATHALMRMSECCQDSPRQKCQGCPACTHTGAPDEPCRA